jgi:hypothetical protein
MVEVVVRRSEEQDFTDLRQVRNAGTGYAVPSIIAGRSWRRVPANVLHVVV